MLIAFWYNTCKKWFVQEREHHKRQSLEANAPPPPCVYELKADMLRS
jgi:hypothetical protein